MARREEQEGRSSELPAAAVGPTERRRELLARGQTARGKMGANAPMVHVEGQEHPISAREAKRRKVEVTGDAGRACVVASKLLRAKRDRASTPCLLTLLSPYALAITGNAPMVHVEGQELPISAREAKRRKVKVTGDAGRACAVGGRAAYAQGQKTKKKKISKGTAKGKADGGELL